mgnify:CR=1 FL=1
MAFQRKIYQKLLDWKNEPKRIDALLIEGSRRVGKTTIVEEFAKNEYKNFLLLDFSVESETVKNLFYNLSDINNFFTNLFLAKQKILNKGDLIIFDEVQNFPLARQAIKHLVKDGRFDYIETGSLLSIRENVENILIPSEERRLEMYPMDFEEFLWAIGKRDLANTIRQCFETSTSIRREIHSSLNMEYRKYLAIGGMPLAINVFLTSGDYMRVHQQKNNICKLYKDDLHKHDLKFGTKCEKVWDALPAILRKTSKRFVVAFENKNSRYSSLSKTFGDIVDSKILNMVNKISEPIPGNELFLKDELFKLYCCDTGLLLTSIYKNQNVTINKIYQDIILGKSDANLGNIYESIVAQTLIANGYKPSYHAYNLEVDGKNKSFEIDFLIERNGKTTAIEVKSGKNFDTKSLNNLKIKYPQMKFERFVISGKEFKKDGDKTYLPLYMAFCL